MAGVCVQLFSKHSAAARARRAGGPAPIKFNLKLGGFGSAVQLDGQGCAMDYPPYRSSLLSAYPHVCVGTMMTELWLYALSGDLIPTSMLLVWITTMVLSTCVLIILHVTPVDNAISMKQLPCLLCKSIFEHSQS